MVIKDTSGGRDPRTVLTRSGTRKRASCNCGQQLDVCARAHCPRCGRTLSHG